MTTIWKDAGVLGLGFLLLSGSVAGCESGTDRKVGDATFLQVCEGTCEGEFECINGLCTRPCEIETDCDGTPTPSACKTLYGIGSCEVFCTEDEECASFGDDFVCSALSCHPPEWTGPPAVGPPGMDWGVIGAAWEVIVKESELACSFLADRSDLVCDLIEVYSPGEDDIGCLLPGRLEFALEADKEALSWRLPSPPEGSELCLDLDCENLKACVVERLTFDGGGEPCMKDEGDSTYFRPGYCILEAYDPDINSTLREWCVEPDNDLGMGGAQLNANDVPVLRVVGEGLPRPGGRLVYMCGQASP